MVVLTILNIIAVVIVSIIILFLLIILLALFSKFRYDVKVDVPFAYVVRASWFLKLVKISIKDGESPVIKFAGMQVGGDEDANSADNEVEAREQPPSGTAPLVDPTAINGRSERVRRSVKARRQRAKTKRNMDFIKQLEIDTLLRLALRLLKDVFLAIKPKKLRIRGKIGFEEPDQTGMAMAAISMLQATGLDVHLAADFDADQRVLELDIAAKGGFRLWRMMRLALKFWQQPEIQRSWQLFNKYTGRNKKRRKQ